MPAETTRPSQNEVRPLTTREKITALLKHIQEFEDFLKSQSGDIDLEQLGWKDHVMKMYHEADNLWNITRMDVFRATSWWLGNIEKSYMNDYTVSIGLVMIQGTSKGRGFIQWITEEVVSKEQNHQL